MDQLARWVVQVRTPMVRLWLYVYDVCALEYKLWRREQNNVA